MSSTGFDSEAEDFRREIEAAGGADFATAPACPKPDLLMAARSGVPFEGSDDVQRHLALCPICQQLSHDLEAYEFPPVSEAEDRRIRARWENAEGRRVRGPFRGWQVLSLVAAGALLVVGVLVMRGTRHSPARPVVARETVPGAPPATPATGIFTLTKAAIKVPASAVLTFRGNADAAKSYMADLATVLEPYRSDDYTEAARRLESLVQKYPAAAEPPYYLGVCRLFLSQNEAAIESLGAARSRTGNTLTDDISWYLAMAFDRAGRTSDALREVEVLCRVAGEYQDRACAAADKLKAR